MLILYINMKQQQAIVAKFRSGEHNVLIATKVAEEGLDFRACNLVVRFDALTTVTGYAEAFQPSNNPATDFGPPTATFRAEDGRELPTRATSSLPRKDPPKRAGIATLFSKRQSCKASMPIARRNRTTRQSRTSTTYPRIRHLAALF